MKRHLRRHRISRQAKEELSRQAIRGRQTPKHHRFARLHPHSRKEELRAERSPAPLPPGRTLPSKPRPTAASDRSAVPGESSPPTPRVGPERSAAVTASPPARATSARQPVAVRVANLLRLRYRIDLNQLIARGNNRDRRLAKHRQRGAPQAAASAISAPSITVPAGSTTWPALASLPRRTIFSPLRIVRSPSRRIASVGALHMLHHHDGVGALRYRRAGHDLDRSAILERTTLPLLPCPHLPRNLQRTRHRNPQPAQQIHPASTGRTVADPDPPELPQPAPGLRSSAAAPAPSPAPSVRLHAPARSSSASSKPTTPAAALLISSLLKRLPAKTERPRAASPGAFLFYVTATYFLRAL